MPGLFVFVWFSQVGYPEDQGTKDFTATAAQDV